MYMKERRHFNFAPVKIEYGRIFIEQKNDTHRPDGSLQKLNQNNRCMFENTGRSLFNNYFLINKLFKHQSRMWRPTKFVLL